jgi:3-hydroxyacyl-CoA dehydrogenase
MLGALFAYASNSVPEISDEIYKIDDVYGWQDLVGKMVLSKSGTL